MALHGKKTYLVAFLLFLTGALAQTDWGKVVEDPKTGLGLLVGAVVMAAMRALTQATTVEAAKQALPPEPGEQ